MCKSISTQKMNTGHGVGTFIPPHEPLILWPFEILVPHAAGQIKAY